jgi:serine/threonine protein kinase
MANSPARAVVDVGSVIADTYKIEALIGRGGMGAVFLASHARLPGKQVAIKLLHAEIENGEVLARFRREAEIASRLGHPNIVAVHDFNLTPDGMPYLVLELLQGETLANRLVSGPMPIDHTLAIIRQVGSALAAAHREGIVHRDLKPHNIFLVPTDVAGRMVEVAKVLDFGISKIRGSQTVKTQDSALLGTPQYMAPEQAMGRQNEVDERTDVFALGAIVHEMLTGQPAFTGASIPEVVFKVVYEQPTPLPASVPPKVAAAVQQAMAKQSSDRFPNVNAFIEALTGSPLTQVRPALTAPDLGFASGSQNVSNHDALANTMDSGNFATPPARVANVRPPISGDAPTINSVSSRPEVSDLPSRPSAVELAHTIAPPTQAASTQPPARKLWPLIAVGALAVAATAGVMFFVMGDDDTSGKQRVAEKRREEKRDEKRDDRPRDKRDDPSRQAIVEPAPIEPTPARVEPKSTEPTPTEPTPTERKPKRTASDEPATPGNPEMREALAEAEAASKRGDRGTALRLTSKIVNDGSDARATAEAHVLRGILLCNDITQANGELRQIPKRFPGLIKKLKANCPSLQ